MGEQDNHYIYTDPSHLYALHISIHSMLRAVKTPCQIRILDKAVSDLIRAALNYMAQVIGANELINGGEDPNYTKQEWREEVFKGHTLLGYTQWVIHQRLLQLD